MRRDIEFNERRRDRTRLAVHAGARKRPLSRGRHGRGMVLREGARAAARRAAVRRHRPRGDSLRLPQLRVERRHPPAAHRPQRATRGLPQRDLLRRDAGRGRLRQDRRVGAVLQRWSRAHPRRHRPAREMRLGADSRRRRISQHAARARDDRLPPVRTALAGRPAGPLPKRRGRIPASRDGRPGLGGLDLALPRDLRDVPRSEAARGSGLREQKHDRIRRAADVVQRRAVPAPPARRPDAGHRGREGRSHAVGSGDRGVQRDPDCEEAARRHRRLDPYDALQRSIAARPGGRRSRRVVCPLPAGRS